jgi:hypothetical protein
MKQTAVEWFVEQLNNRPLFNEQFFKEVFEQAKEIEKQQIKDAYISGMYDAHSKTSIDYYKENYETTV